QPVAGQRVGGIQLFLSRSESTVLVDGVIHEVHVEVAVAVVIEKGGLCAEAGEVQPIFFCFVAIAGNAVLADTLANEQLVMRDRQPFETADLADIDIQQAVVVDVYYRNTGGPAAVLRNAGAVGDIAEAETAVVEIEPVLF